MTERTIADAMGMDDTEIAELRRKVDALGPANSLDDDVVGHGAVLRAAVAEQGLVDRAALLVDADAPHGRLCATSTLRTGEQNATVSHDGERAS